MPGDDEPIRYRITAGIWPMTSPQRLADMAVKAQLFQAQAQQHRRAAQRCAQIANWARAQQRH